MKEFIVGLGVGLIFSAMLIGLMMVDYQRQFRELEDQAYSSCQDARYRAYEFGRERSALYREIGRLKK